MSVKIGLGMFAVVFALTGCEKSARLSKDRAQAHVEDITKAASTDVEEVRAGLPKGAELLVSAVAADSKIRGDAQELHHALERARNKVQDLRVAKSTFFAVTDERGVVLRNDQEQDAMAGKSVLDAYPGLRGALEGKYVEASGSMPEAAGLRGRDDAQWVAAQPIGDGGAVRGLYVTGWSWSSYAYRLEFSLRSSVRSQLAEAKGQEKEPLLYVFVVTRTGAFGSPESPDVNVAEVKNLGLLDVAKGEETVGREIEITGRGFGIAFRRTPALGIDVGIAVLRSET